MQDIKKQGEPKHSRAWYMRLLAGVLVIVLIVTTVVYNYFTDNIADLQPTAFQEEGNQVTIDPKILQENLGAIRKARVLQDKLNKDYKASAKYVQEGDYAAALEPTEELYEYLKEDETVGAYLRVTLSELYFMNAKYKECASVAEDIIKREEDVDGTYQFMAGIAYMQSKEFEKAIDRLEGALQVGYPQEGMCKAQLSLAYMYVEAYDKAYTCSTQVLEAEHDATLDETLLYIKGVSQLQMNDFEGSIGTMDQLLNSSPKGEYYYYKGIAHMALEQYEEATDSFENATVNGYEETGCYYNLGICASMNQDNEKAKKAFQVVVDRDDDEEYTASAKEVLKNMEQ